MPKQYKKILNISSIRELRGGDIQMLNIIKQFRKQDIVKNFVLTRKNAAIIPQLKNEKIPYFEAPRASNLDFRFTFKIIQIIKKLSIDIIHVHDSTALTFTILASYFLPSNIKILYSRKSNNAIKDKKLNRWKYNHPSINKIICVTKEVNNVMSKSITDLSKLITIYDGISVEEKAPLPLETIYKKSEENEILIGTLAGLTEAKDIFTFIDTAKKIAKIYPNAHFLIFGDGKLKPELEEYSKLQGTEKYVHFLGFVENAGQYLSHLQVYLITSIREGLPLSLYEAFLMKIPVVSTNISSIPEVIIEEKTGMLCNPKDSDSLASKVIRLIEDQELKGTITLNAHQLVKEKFTLDIVFDNYYQFYNSLI